MNSKHLKRDISENIFATLLFVAFLFLRPILTINLLPSMRIAGLNVLEIFSISVTYAFLIYTCLNIKRIKFDSICWLLIIFAGYSIFSLAWGSSVREIAKLLLPVCIFFMVRSINPGKNYLRLLYMIAILGLAIPTIGSGVLIGIGKGLGMTVYQTGLERYSGLYFGIHSLAHASYIVLPLSLLFLESSNDSLTKNKAILLLTMTLITFSFFCMYKSYVRTTWVGTFILTNFYLLKKRKYVLLTCMYIIILILAFSSENLEKAFHDFIKPISGQEDISLIGSSRFGIWKDIIDLIYENGIVRLILGLGFTEYGQITSYGKSGSLIAIAHNDFLGLLLSLGLVGLIIYTASLFNIYIDIYKSKIKGELKSIFLGFLIAVVAMNILSNSYLSRIEMSQYFYFIIGSFYAYRDKVPSESISEI